MSEENVSLPVAQALASALEKIEAYVPTEYVDNSEPDIDAEHLNHAEQGIMRVTNLLNAAVDVIQGQESRLADAETKIGTAELTGGMTDLSSGLNSLNSNLQSFLMYKEFTTETRDWTPLTSYRISHTTPSGYRFLAYCHTRTNGWVGSVHPTPININEMSDLWVAVGSGTGTVTLGILFIKAA